MLPKKLARRGKEGLLALLARPAHFCKYLKLFM
jgi:hypothetical protein